ncbi:hypothetical protein [Anaerosolibacter sp.]|uniref:hypothetical protein n=1 Tax=Anaerosolibacter sp. TaxID=1872527 RepID=UPI0039F0F2F1
MPNFIDDVKVNGTKVIDKDFTPASAIANHADPATATSTEIATKQNAILAALRAANIITT